jgi:MinD superfamily P-loop ATPase
MGISIVREYIDSLAVDQNSADLVDMLNKLLKKDAKGNLKPNRILDLQNLADQKQNETLNKGVEIIRESYKAKRSAIFIEAAVPDTIPGTSKSVALSITSADFPEGFTPNFDVFK